MKSISLMNKFIWLSFALIAALLVFRIFYSGSIRYTFLVWNIFLAWIPYVLSGLLKFYVYKPGWKQVIMLGTWLLFFPNALYIVTDLVHLRADTNVPWWFDAMFLFLNAFVGLILAFTSLLYVESFLRSRFNSRQTSFIILLFLFMGSYGVYLGRFERWNSWNILNEPFSLASAIVESIFNPFEHGKVWAITILFTLVYTLLFYSIRILPSAIKQHKNTGL